MSTKQTGTRSNPSIFSCRRFLKQKFKRPRIQRGEQMRLCSVHRTLNKHDAVPSILYKPYCTDTKVSENLTVLFGQNIIGSSFTIIQCNNFICFWLFICTTRSIHHIELIFSYYLQILVLSNVSQFNHEQLYSGGNLCFTRVYLRPS